jgi:outer membrane lipoprotein-sorting protein
MADLQDVIGLLYRADWTRLNVSADVRSESDQDLLMSRVRAMRPPWVSMGFARRFKVDEASSTLTWEEALSEEERRYHTWDTRLLIAPGGRYRQEDLDEPPGQVTGSDGESSWVWQPQDRARPDPPVDLGHKPPLDQMFRPSWLLNGFTLEVQGPVTACGRDAIAVVATPRTSTDLMPRLRATHLADRLEVIVDAELGFLLRCEEAFEGQRMGLTELTALVLDPQEAADDSRFAPPAGSQIKQDVRQSPRETLSGPGSEVAKAFAGLASGALGASIRFAQHRSNRPDSSEGEPQAAMPLAEPGVEPEGGPAPSDDLLYLLYRSGENPALTATLREWHDQSAMTARFRDSVHAAGGGGVGFLWDSLTAATRDEPVTLTISRVGVSGRDKYRVDYLTPRSGRGRAKTIACDGEHHWVEHEDHILVGPANPLSRPIANLVEPEWLLECRLSGGAEVSYRGRRAYQLRAAKGEDGRLASPLLFFPADVIVDAELGCLLRLIAFAGERPALWYELSDIGTDPVPAGEFRLDVPPGVRVVEETGNLFTDTAAVMPGVAGNVVRTAADVVRHTNDAVSAARSFLDDLLGRSRS